MKKISFISFILFLILSVSITFAQNQCKATYGDGPNKFALATGSPGELGLVKTLAENFNKTNKNSLCWIKAGSGDSLKLLKEKKVDMVMVHAPKAEKKAIEEGWATMRFLIGSNEFYIVGESTDPAKIAEAKDIVDAYTRISKSQSKFFSRGDNSGTHKKEMQAWEKAGIKPEGNWYIITKDFMKATLKRANDEKGYFMTDSSTWVAEKKNLPNLKILFKGDKFLINTYHTLCQPKGSTPGAEISEKFIEFIKSPEGQKIIAEYGKDVHGESLYNDAEYAKKYDD